VVRGKKERTKEGTKEGTKEEARMDIWKEGQEIRMIGRPERRARGREKGRRGGSY
jgi:hypothetical protein